MNYKVQDGCWNCKNAFVYTEYDEGETCYCTKNKDKRPLCGSVAMGESYRKSLSDFGFNLHIEKLINAWNEWSDKYIVRESGICEEWVTKR